MAVGFSKSGKALIWIVFLTTIFIVILTTLEKQNSLNDHHSITTGIVTGKSKAAKGEWYVDYLFIAGNRTYTGSKSIAFCNQCGKACCDKNARVRVKYETGNPANSDLLR